MMKPDDKTGYVDAAVRHNAARPAGKSAYPGTMLISTDVPTRGLTRVAGDDYGEFLAFALAPGQTTGLGIGQLPPGYLPLTAANGAGKIVAYTKAAAADVSAQNSKVPSLNGGEDRTAVRHIPLSPAPSASSPTPEWWPADHSGSTPGTVDALRHRRYPGQALRPGPDQHPADRHHGRPAVHGLSGRHLAAVLLIALIGGTVAFGGLAAGPAGGAEVTALRRPAAARRRRGGGVDPSDRSVQSPALAAGGRKRAGGPQAGAAAARGGPWRWRCWAGSRPRFWFVLYALLISGLQEKHAQHVLYSPAALGPRAGDCPARWCDQRRALPSRTCSPRSSASARCRRGNHRPHDLASGPGSPAGQRRCRVRQATRRSTAAARRSARRSAACMR